MNREIGTVQWIYWIGATLVAAVLTVSFAYGNFLTKSEADISTRFIVDRLDRIESKLDSVLEKH